MNFSIFKMLKIYKKKIIVAKWTVLSHYPKKKIYKYIEIIKIYKFQFLTFLLSLHPVLVGIQLLEEKY